MKISLTLPRMHSESRRMEDSDSIAERKFAGDVDDLSNFLIGRLNAEINAAIAAEEAGSDIDDQVLSDFVDAAQPRFFAVRAYPEESAMYFRYDFAMSGDQSITGKRYGLTFENLNKEILILRDIVLGETYHSIYLRMRDAIASKPSNGLAYLLATGIPMKFVVMPSGKYRDVFLEEIVERDPFIVQHEQFALADPYSAPHAVAYDRKMAVVRRLQQLSCDKYDRLFIRNALDERWTVDVFKLRRDFVRQFGKLLEASKPWSEGQVDVFEEGEPHPAGEFRTEEAWERDISVDPLTRDYWIDSINEIQTLIMAKLSEWGYVAVKLSTLRAAGSSEDSGYGGGTLMRDNRHDPTRGDGVTVRLYRRIRGKV